MFWLYFFTYICFILATLWFSCYPLFVRRYVFVVSAFLRLGHLSSSLSSANWIEVFRFFFVEALQFQVGLLSSLLLLLLFLSLCCHHWVCVRVCVFVHFIVYWFLICVVGFVALCSKCIAVEIVEENNRILYFDSYSNSEKYLMLI